MCRRRPGVHPGQLVVLSFETGSALAAPHQADHVDRLFERVDGFAPRPQWPADRLDRLEAPARSEPELNAPAAEQVESGSGLGEDRRRAEREVGDIWKDLDSRPFPSPSP
jgi:hypothetical protein